MIFRKANESLTAFKERWTVETGFIMGVPEVMKISSFMDAVKSPELAKLFSNKFLPRASLVFNRRDNRSSQNIHPGESRRSEYRNNYRGGRHTHHVNRMREDRAPYPPLRGEYNHRVAPVPSLESLTKPAKHVDTPFPENTTLNHIESDEDHLLDNIGNYHKLMGKLIYLTNTRPDISYVVHCLSQYMHAPLVSHLDVALRVLRYLMGSPWSGIQINKSGTKVIFRNKGDPIRLDFESKGTKVQDLGITKEKEVMDEDLGKPFKEARRTPLICRIIEFAGPEYKMPANIKLYDYTTEPEDHLSRFASAANSGEWPMPVYINEWADLKEVFAARTELPRGEMGETYRRASLVFNRRDNRSSQNVHPGESRRSEYRNNYRGGRHTYHVKRMREDRAPYPPLRGEYNHRVAPVPSLESLTKRPKEILATKTQLRLPAPRPMLNPLRTATRAVSSKLGKK
nr:ribonuclease H-like domain-containing protein [Tanacetum cinerariifolium]